MKKRLLCVFCVKEGGGKGVVEEEEWGPTRVPRASPRKRIAVEVENPNTPLWPSEERGFKRRRRTTSFFGGGKGREWAALLRGNSVKTQRNKRISSAEREGGGCRRKKKRGVTHM